MFAKRIRAVRKKLNLSQKDVSERLDVSNITISRYEIGKMMPGLDILQKFIHEFNVNANWMLSGQGPMFNNGEIIKEEEAPYIIGSNINLEKELIACQKEISRLREQNDDLNEELRDYLKRMLEIQSELIHSK